MSMSMSVYINFVNLIKVFICVLVVILFMTYFMSHVWTLSIRHKYKSHNYKKWFQCKKNEINKIFRLALSNNGLTITFDRDWDILLPCDNKYDEKTIKNIIITKPHQLISYISRNGILGSKLQLWITLRNYYGRDKASEIMTPSYIFPEDRKIFDKEYVKTKYYVMKSEKQRQTGLKITNNYDEIVNSDKKGYKIVQEYIKNPLTFRGYKINFRVYLLIFCNCYHKSGYVFDDGIISYSKKRVDEKKKINFDQGVASFYTSKELYKKNYPITIKEMEKYMNLKQFWINARYNLQKVLNASINLMCIHKFKYNNPSFQIFGVDFMVSNGKPHILEINIGPGMNPFCGRDEKMRLKLHNDMLQIVMNASERNGFTKIY